MKGRVCPECSAASKVKVQLDGCQTDGSMGRKVYLPALFTIKNQTNVGNYTIPMDPGSGDLFNIPLGWSLNVWQKGLRPGSGCLFVWFSGLTSNPSVHSRIYLPVN